MADRQPLPQLVRRGEKVMPKDEVQRFLDEEKTRQERKQALIQQLLDARDAAVKEFDDQLALLGYLAEPVSRLSGPGASGEKPRRTLSEQTKAKMKTAQQARWSKVRSGK